MSEQPRRPRPKRPPSNNRRPNPQSQQHRKKAVQLIMWNMSGGSIPDSVIKKFDDAMQAVMDEVQDRVRLAATVVKV